LFENDYYLLSGELQQLDTDMLEHKERGEPSTPNSTESIFSHLGRMMRTSDVTRSAMSYSF